MSLPKPLAFAGISIDTLRSIRGIFCDIDDTLTWEGHLVPAAFNAMDRAKTSGLRVVPITGRPAGWVDHLARMWPVDGVVGENGGLWFWHDGKRLQRRFIQDISTRQRNRRKLEQVATQILTEVPGCALASDQPFRELDLAIDFCEDVPRLLDRDLERIVEIFKSNQATCKVSSIHVNGWYGSFDKLVGCRRFVEDRWNENLDSDFSQYLYFGDSANDEPMFAAFPHSVGVANVEAFLPKMKAWPKYITQHPGGFGFAEAVERLLEFR